MLEKMLTPLLLVNIMGELRGKTRFQKLTFLIQNNALEENVSKLDYGFRLYHYGPFSTELSSIIDDLVLRNYLQEVVEATPSGYLRHAYRLTPQGRDVVEEVLQKELISSGLLRIIHKNVALYGNLPLDLLVKKAYDHFESWNAPPFMP